MACQGLRVTQGSGLCRELESKAGNRGGREIPGHVEARAQSLGEAAAQGLLTPTGACRNARGRAQINQANCSPRGTGHWQILTTWARFGSGVGRHIVETVREVEQGKAGPGCLRCWESPREVSSSG